MCSTFFKGQEQIVVLQEDQVRTCTESNPLAALHSAGGIEFHTGSTCRNRETSRRCSGKRRFEINGIVPAVAGGGKPKHAFESHLIDSLLYDTLLENGFFQVGNIINTDLGSGSIGPGRTNVIGELLLSEKTGIKKVIGILGNILHDLGHRQALILDGSVRPFADNSDQRPIRFSVLRGFTSPVVAVRKNSDANVFSGRIRIVGLKNINFHGFSPFRVNRSAFKIIGKLEFRFKFDSG